ncbi:hypothetical protein AV530_009356 [Patagioenas fasciata monilis]|uniref:Uncharacterized protein n=1 Tax=Patagioenas fasciata monilis TaxID=372326 RepID=A0A1V4JJU7_PATFA|nr:hypothetical protein AV530_009356 [Patagioenas fasciata monilis]
MRCTGDDPSKPVPARAMQDTAGAPGTSGVSGRFPGGIPTNEQSLEKEGEEEPSSVQEAPVTRDQNRSKQPVLLSDVARRADR